MISPARWARQCAFAPVYPYSVQLCYPSRPSAGALAPSRGLCYTARDIPDSVRDRSCPLIPRLIYAVVAAVICCPPAVRAACELDFPPPLAQAAKLRAGSRPESVWNQHPAIARLEHYFFDYLPTQQTDVRLAYDDANLYVAMRCLEAEPGKMRTEQTRRDSDLMSDDCVSVYLDPDDNPKTYFHLCANADGVQYDETDRAGFPERWDGKWSVNTSLGGKEWRALFTIPFSTLGVRSPRDGARWRANFGRRSVPCRERGIWATVRGHLVEPDRWGAVVFAGADALTVTCSLNDMDSTREVSPVATRAAGTCSEPATSIRAPGPVSLRFATANTGSKPAPLRVEIRCDGQVIHREALVARPGAGSHIVSFPYAREGLHYLSASVLDSRDGRLVARTQAIAQLIKPHRETISKLERLAARAKPPTTQLHAERRELLADLKQLSARAAAAVGSEAKWSGLDAPVESARAATGRLLAACADREGRGYSVGVETTARKILRDRPFEGSFTGTARIEACRGEFEGVQLAVFACGRDLQDIRVSAAGLNGPSGAEIPASRVTLTVVDYVKTGWPRYASEYAGWWPDPLMPNAPFSLNSGEMRPVWLTVQVPADTPAGTYKGDVFVKPANAPETRLTLEVRVHDVTLPVTGRFKTAFALFEHELAAWYGEVTPEMRRDWYAFLLEHRINPTNIYSQTAKPDREDMEFCVERGLNAYTLACTWYKDENDRAGMELAGRVRSEREYLKQKGWLSLPYIYGFDEVDFRKYGELKDTYGWLGRRFPDIPRMCTVRPVEDLAGFVDIWVPLTSHWVEEDVKAARDRGDQVWNYVCCHPLHPWPNFFVDYPAIDQRIIPWMNWKFGVPGLLYYAINLWETNRDPEKGRHDDDEAAKAIAAGKRWPDVPWNTFTCADFNGDGHLVYPGRDGRPISSVRLANIRDGIEDYECLAVLSDLIARAEREKADPSLISRAKRVVRVPDDVVRSFREYTLDPGRLLQARSDLLDVTARLARALDSGSKKAPR